MTEPQKTTTLEQPVNNTGRLVDELLRLSTNKNVEENEARLIKEALASANLSACHFLLKAFRLRQKGLYRRLESHLEKFL